VPTRPRAHGAGAPLLRFDAAERALHWSVALLVLVLIGTGLLLYIPAAAAVVGHRLLVEDVHVLAGVLLPVPLVAALSGGGAPQLRADLRRLDRVRREEWRWLRSLGRTGRDRLGKFNPGQKLNAAVLSGALGALFLSGLALATSAALPLPWRIGATFVHDVMAAVVVVLVAGHVAMALAHPESLRSMIRGRISRGWAAVHAPRWLAEEEAAQRRESDSSPARHEHAAPGCAGDVPTPGPG
jgi:formate dehydrogenase subunit gamma